MANSYTTSIEVRFSDLDAYGHVNNAVYFTYLEIARIKLLGKSFDELSDMGIFTVVAKAKCTYKIPMKFHDVVVITAWIAKVGRSSFEVEYHLHDGKDTTYATASTTMVCYNGVNKTTVPVPDEIRAMGPTIVHPETPGQSVGYREHDPERMRRD